MGTGLQRHVRSSAARLLTGFAQRVDLGMGLASPHVITRPHHLFGMCDDAADARIGMGGVEAKLGEAQGVRHVQVVDGGEWGGHAGSLWGAGGGSLGEEVGLLVILGF